MSGMQSWCVTFFYSCEGWRAVEGGCEEAAQGVGKETGKQEQRTDREGK